MTPPRAKRTAPAQAVEVEDLDQKDLSWAMVRRLVGFTQPYTRVRNVLLLLVVVRALQLPLISWMLAWVLGGPIADGNLEAAFWGSAGFAALVLFTELVFMYRMRLALQLGESVVYDMRRQIYTQLYRMPMEFFDRMPLGRLISRVTSDVDVVRQGIQDVFFVSIVQGGSMLIAALIMLYYDWLLFLVVALLVPALWLLLQTFRERMRQAYRDVQETYSRVTASLAESVAGMRVLQGFVREQKNERRFSELVTTHAENHLEGARQAARFFPLVEINSQLFLALLLVVGGYQALHGAVDLETVIQFFFLSELFFGPVVVLGRQYNLALTAMAGAERVFGILDAEPGWQDAPNAVQLEALEGHVRFERASFEYTPGRPVLRDVDLNVVAGQMVALVGATGSGKTTLTRLLAKLYLPTSGRILLDGRDLSEIAGSSLHVWLGMVPQDNRLFSGTIADNIRFARPEARAEELAEVVQQLGIEDVIGALPDGLETEVGDRGVNVSLGQRQLICFARAMVADPRLLILDEATSSVDAVTEAKLQQALGKLLEGRTSFVVAHRLSTVRDADVIVVLDDGRIVQQGTHAELLAQTGHYSELYRELALSLEGGGRS